MRIVLLFRNFDRLIRLSRKFIGIILLGLRPTAIYGRLTGPKILINSIPKSGTNLLQELIHHLPSIHGSVQKVLTSSMDEDQIVDAILKISRGQCVPAHVFYTEALASALIANNVKMILVVRDLRDSLMSHISYLETMDLTHPHRQYYDVYDTIDQKLDAYLKGTDNFESWQAMAKNYRGWRDFPGVFIVKYEEIMANSDAAIRSKIVTDLSQFIGAGAVDTKYLLRIMINEKGLTYNNPAVGRWRKSLSNEQINKLNLHLAEELIFWGYSID